MANEATNMRPIGIVGHAPHVGAHRNDKAFQDGIELESAIIMDSKTYDSDEKMKDIKPGKTIKVQSAFVLNDKKNPVEIEVSELISFSDKKVVKTFELQ